MHFRFAFLILISTGFAFTSAAAPKGEPGLLATLSDESREFTRVTPGPNFSLKDGESIDPRLTSSFHGVWKGSLNIVKREKYTFSLEGAGESGKLTIDGKPVGASALELDVGEHPIQIEYARLRGPARQQLVWSAEDFLPEPVPQTALLHRESPSAVADDDAEAGRLLVESLNCVACHQTRSKGIVGRTAPDLTAAGNRLKSAWVAKWLADPHAYRPNAMMPRVPLEAGQRSDLTAYLATVKDSQNRIKEKDSKPADHISNGERLFESIGCLSCHDKLKGDANPQKFSLRGIGSKWLTWQLSAYLQNPLSIDHSGRMPSMLLSADEARDLAEYLTESHDEKFESAPTSRPAESVARGKELFQSTGCVQCHVVERGKKTVAAQGATLEEMKPDRGCLAEKPAGKAMDYQLSPGQRKQIVTFLTSIRKSPLVSDSPTTEFYHKVATFGCTNCHELDLKKPAEETERIPLLTNVGARMRTEWINQVLTDRKRVRPWLHRRMPEFGRENVGNVAELATAVSGSGPADAVPSPNRDETLAGQKIVGSGAGGLACITCHGFNGAKPPVADDTRGPDLASVADRLRPDHFRRWVYDPKRVNPATPMPSFFEGVPAHEAAEKIETIYRYCALGRAMPPPVGWVDENNYTLAVRETPIVQRCVLPNLNGGSNFPRGIAVGLPGLVSYCFDAETCALRYAWSGGFIDMQPSWAQRGGNEVHVLGKRFWGTNVFPLHVGNADAEQPKPQFEGYTLDEHSVPTWHYRIGKVEVAETVTASETGFGIVRKFEVDPHDWPVVLMVEGTNIRCSLASAKTEDFYPDPKKAQKVEGLVAEVGNSSPVRFTVTLTAKEEK